MDSTRRGIQSLRSSVIQLNASISDYKGWSFAQSYSLFDWFKKNLQKPLDRPDGEVKLIVAWLLALSHAALRAVSMFSTTLFDSNLFFWLTLVSVVIFFKRPSTGKHSLTIWEYFLTGVEVRGKKDSNYSNVRTKWMFHVSLFIMFSLLLFSVAICTRTSPIWTTTALPVYCYFPPIVTPSLS